ncbi:MAG: hypothetical protein ABR521_08440 [Gaiellaceae bacterium]
MARVVFTPGGTQWLVRRRWVRRPRWGWHGWTPGGGDLLAGGDLSLGGLAIGLALLVAVTLLAVFLLPLLLFLVQLAVVLLAVPLRFLLGRPWTVEALSSDGARHEWLVRGWRASGRRIDRIAHALEVGRDPGAPDVPHADPL